jgi:kinetochore protein Nuf2
MAAPLGSHRAGGMRSVYATPRPTPAMGRGQAPLDSTGKRSRAVTPASGRSSRQYSFPLLPPTEIVACMQELRIPFSEQQLMQPTPEHVRLVLEQLVELLTATRREELASPVPQALEALGFPELHDESASVVMFHRAVQRLMKASGIHDFSFNDYLKPEYPRLRRILSGVINFAKFREERLIQFQKITNRSEEAIQRQQELQMKCTDLEMQIRKWNERIASEQPKLAALESETGELASEITSLNKKQLQLQVQIRELKGKVNEYADQIANHKFELLQTKQEIAKLQAMIVSSPERVQQQLLDMESSLEREKRLVERLEHEHHLTQAETQALQEALQQLEELLKVLEDAELQVSRCKQARDVVQRHRSELQEKEQALRVLEQEASQLERQITAAEERISRVRTQLETRLADAQKEFATLEAEHEEVVRERVEAEQVAHRNHLLVQQIQDRMQGLRHEHREQMTRLREQYAELEQEVIAYHRRLFSALQRWLHEAQHQTTAHAISSS